MNQAIPGKASVSDRIGSPLRHENDKAKASPLKWNTAQASPHSPQPHCHEYTTCIPSPKSPLHLRISSRGESVEIECKMECPQTNNDDRSDVSPLQCGSVPANPKYDPAHDPELTNIPFVPPIEIWIRTKELHPDKSKLDHPLLLPKSTIRKLHRNKSAPQPDMPPSIDFKRRNSCHSRMEFKRKSKKSLSSVEHFETSSEIDSDDEYSSYYTTPTELLSDGSNGSIGILREGKNKGHVRREIRHRFKVKLFKRKDKKNRLKEVNADLHRCTGQLA